MGFIAKEKGYWTVQNLSTSFFFNLRTPSTHSSMNVKDLVCRPSPHISKRSVEVRAFLQKAAGAFSLPPI
jgi:hypothetical protein